ncbi:MAG: thio(seleno)oxazole modification radical SAM maturase SbtM [bacterium]
MTCSLPQEEGKRRRMHPSGKIRLEGVFPVCHAVLGVERWNQLMTECGDNPGPEALVQAFISHQGKLGVPEFLSELARLELVINEAADENRAIPPEVDHPDVNPTVHLLDLTWRNLYLFVSPEHGPSSIAPEPGDERILVWRHPKTGDVMVNPATDQELLVLKMIFEGIEPEDVAVQGGLPVGAVDQALRRAADMGLILAPRSRIRRDGDDFPRGEIRDEAFLESPFFTIQWHVTQACDLHCRHCYDRSERSPLRLDQGIGILEDLRAFCRDRHVMGQVSFSGGNPLLYPHFLDLYRAASDRGFVIAILGNPASKETIGALCAIQRPAFYQVSLEGLKEHNDYIRGPGTFDRAIEFLSVLRDFDIPSQVMLTLTRDNIDQVLPLAEMLRDHAGSFNFNRLSQVGEGADLHLPTNDEYAAFLHRYVEAAKDNPVMGLKDNLINIIRYQQGEEPFGGCAGYGCSAAFNFVAVLPDGEVHACRKFPSLIGNIFENSLAEIYDSDIARRYRSGTKACRSCPIRPVCGGCLAVVHGQGLDIFEDRDPYCFMGTV